MARITKDGFNEDREANREPEAWSELGRGSFQTPRPEDA